MEYSRVQYVRINVFVNKKSNRQDVQKIYKLDKIIKFFENQAIILPHNNIEFH